MGSSRLQPVRPKDWQFKESQYQGMILFFERIRSTKRRLTRAKAHVTNICYDSPVHCEKIGAS